LGKAAKTEPLGSKDFNQSSQLGIYITNEVLGGENMPSNINIYSIKINNISNNGSLNIGDALHNSHSANTKSQGTNSSYGDISPTTSGMENVFIDPDGNDQGDIATPANVNANQT
jgi:hypothetical protein